MIHSATMNIIELLRQLVCLLQPYAQIHDIDLEIEAKEKQLLSSFRPDKLINDMTGLICSIISYLPRQNKITVSINTAEKQTGVELAICIRNTGINLSTVAEITNSCSQRVTVKGDNEAKQTEFIMNLPMMSNDYMERKLNAAKPVIINRTIIPEYYDEIRKRLRSHFSKADNLVAQLSILYPKEANFLQKVNAVIITNLENELFDTSVLSREMNMSRTQLFRRLKPLIHQPPATYIKSIRLQKAKELLETKDISVGEAAFKTGFQNLGHFTNAFSVMFGFRPSAIKRNGRDATKE